ncbi:MAG TPA: GGDEF domain-containing protein [Acidimicrobiales bacterium]|nr:GGDEF domain-containing protein [Acidimicrobiales bacterium]
MDKLTLDDLTGLLDRDGVLAAVDGIDHEAPLALALVDIDGFKEVNDTSGHAAGDEVLRRVAATLRGSLPDDAIVARFGGDELVVAFPDRSAEGALILLEEVRAHLAAHPMPPLERPVTVSIGVAARPPHGSTFGELLRAADQAMYRAKAEGRNRVAIHVDEKMVMKSNYYDRAALARLAKLSANTGRTEASLLREALDDLFVKHATEL